MICTIVRAKNKYQAIKLDDTVEATARYLLCGKSGRLHIDMLWFAINSQLPTRDSWISEKQIKAAARRVGKSVGYGVYAFQF